MTNSNKILLSTLLQIEKTLNHTQNSIDSSNLPISIEFKFSDFYNLFDTIVTAFSIPEKKFDILYDILDQFLENKFSIPVTLKEIDKLVN